MLSNESHFQNPEFDALLATARSTLDFEEHRSAYPAAQQLIAEEGGNLILYHVNEFYIMSAAIQGVLRKVG